MRWKATSETGPRCPGQKATPSFLGRRIQSRSEPFSLPPQQNAQTATLQGCHPSHNPYDPLFDAHEEGRALFHTLSPGQHLTVPHITTNPPVFSSERRFVPPPLNLGHHKFQRLTHVG